MVAKRKQPTLIIVHTKELLYQWQEKIVQFLGIPKEKIGLVGDGKKSVGKKATIAIVNSLRKCAHEIKDKIGFLVVDEAHRTPSATFTEAVQAFDCAYMLGLSATPYRRDGLSRLIFFYIGDRVHEIKVEHLQETNHIMKATLRVRETGFNYYYNDNYPEMITELTQNYPRNELIVEDVIHQSESNLNIALVITDRVTHCQTLYQMLLDRGIESRLLLGCTPCKERKAIVNELNQGNVSVLMATSQLVGEGFDLKHLSSIFLCTPVKYHGRLVQYVGRILRTSVGKNKSIIFDYVDTCVGVLQSSFKSRSYAYQRMGIEIV